MGFKKMLVLAVMVAASVVWGQASTHLRMLELYSQQHERDERDFYEFQRLQKQRQAKRQNRQRARQEQVAAAQVARLQELQKQQEQQRQMQAAQSQNQIVATPLTYREILSEAGLSQYIPLFEQHRITDVNMIRSLTNDELREMGVEAIGDRRRIMEAFAMAPVNTVVVTNVVRPFAEKGVKNLGFGFLTGWGTGIGGNVAWNVGLSDILSFGLGTTYSAGMTASLRHMYLTPNCRLALHFFSFPSLASRESLSRHDLHIAIRAGATFIWWNDNSDTDFMFDFGMGYRFRLTERTFLLMDGGKENMTVGLGFRF